MAVVLGEDQGLRHLGAAGEDLGEELVPEGADDGADLVLGDDVAVEVARRRRSGPRRASPSASRAGLAVAELVDHVPGLDRRAALLGDLGADPVDVEVDVDAVGDGLLVACTPSRGSG